MYKNIDNITPGKEENKRFLKIIKVFLLYSLFYLMYTITIFRQKMEETQVADQKWSDVGDSISKMVQEAIDSQNFSKLSDTIQNTVSTAVGSAVTGAAKGMGVAADSMIKSMKTVSKAQNPWKGNGEFERKTGNYMMSKDVPQGALYSTGSRASGYILMTLGGVGTFGLGITELILGIIALVTEANLILPIAILGVLLICSIFFWSRGRASLGRISRFKNYVRMLGKRTCITLGELASGSGRSESFVLKDVRDMLSRGMFRQGHLDESAKNLFVTNESFHAYTEDKSRAEAVKANEAKKERERAADPAMTEEVKRVITEGRTYIDKIHAANREIQDAEVSRKLDDLEATVAKIFEYVEAYPESAPETKKLMKYYLPTTIKLLDSYQKLGDYSRQGQNISNSRKQIEDTLDTLNQAFARLFDNLYQDTSMDINSDISVLNTMLAQEGLTGNRI